MEKAIKYTLGEKGIGELLIDLPLKKVNVLSSQVFEDLKEILKEVSNDKELKVLIVRSGKPGQFIAGADITEFTTIKNKEEAEKISLRGQELFNQIEDLKVPTIAVIEGPCLGGGLEFALACKYRIVADEKETSLGLPEVQLGLLPGWGGTQRLPKIVGLPAAAQMILTGKTIDARRAFKMGLADGIASKSFLQDEINKLICKIEDSKERIALSSRRKNMGGWQRTLIENNPIGRTVLFKQAEKKVLSESHGHYPAPFEVIKVMRESYGMRRSLGMAVERQGIGSLLNQGVTKSLIRLFFLNQKVKKDPGANLEGNIHPIKQGAVVGAGTMGGGIAWLFSKTDTPVLMKDISWDAVSLGFQAASKIYHQLTKIKKMAPPIANLKMHSISGTVDYEGFKQVDLVIEAVIEDLDIKNKVLKELEGVVREDTIIATNTSSLPLSAMVTSLKNPERFVGLHFFNPVNRMPLVEVILTPQTSPDVAATVVDWVRKSGKTPIVVKDCSGFLVNRILMSYINEAGFLLNEGVDFELIDQVMVKFGMPMGPFELLDQIGFDVAAKVAKSVEKSYGSRAKAPRVFEEIAGSGLYGKKTGGGFYKNTKKRNPKMDKLLAPYRKKEVAIDKKEIKKRLLFAMINEASRCLDEEIVSSADHLDMAMILGTGFPPFRGGLLYYADTIGIQELVKGLRKFEKEHGERFSLNPLLLNMESENKKFI